MVHDVFISYASENKKTADAICHMFEENNVKCWIAPRDVRGGKNFAGQIKEAIENTKLVVLVYSKVTEKSQYVNSEIHLAFSEGKSILTYNISNKEPEGDLKFFLGTSHWLESYPNPKTNFGELLKDTVNILEIEPTPYDPPIPKPNLKQSLQKLFKENKKISLILLTLMIIGASGYLFYSFNGSLDTGINNGFYKYEINGVTFNIPNEQKLIDIENDYVLLFETVKGSNNSTFTEAKFKAEGSNSSNDIEIFVLSDEFSQNDLIRDDGDVNWEKKELNINNNNGFLYYRSLLYGEDLIDIVEYFFVFNYKGQEYKLCFSL